MSEIPLFLVSHLKTNRTLNDMAKVQIKSEKTTLFKRIFSIIEQFDALCLFVHMVDSLKCK